MAVISKKELQEQELLSFTKLLTSGQMAELTGRSQEHINAMTLQLRKSTNKTKLDTCYPFPNSKRAEDRESGPRLIVRNQKCEDLIEACRQKAVRGS